MGGRSRMSRRQMEDSDTDSESGDPSTIPPAPDGRTDAMRQLLFDDLSNAARDRLTAHDRERDRVFDQQELDKIRLCNQKGRAEFKDAEKDKDALKAWASMGDDTEGLDNIADGQYHRIRRTQEMEEIRQKAVAIGINPEHVNLNLPPRPRSGRGRGGPAYHDRGRGRARNPLTRETPGASDRPLDPAVDPNRVYKYANGTTYGTGGSTPNRGQTSARGGHAMARGGRGTAPGRKPLINVQNLPQTHSAVTSTVRGKERARGLAGRAALQRQPLTQDRPWPSVALAEHLSELPAQQQQKQPTTGISTPPAASIESPIKVSFPTEGLINDVQATSPAAPAVVIQAPTSTQISESARKRPPYVGLLDDTDAFFKAVPKAVQASPSQQPSQPKPRPQPNSIDVKADLNQDSQVQVPSDPRTSDAVNTTKPTEPREDFTDGRPTPSALSGFTSSPPVTVPSTSPELLGLGVSGIGPFAKSTDRTSNSSARAVQDFLSDDGSPQIRQEPLEPQKAKVRPYIVVGGQYYTLASPDFKPDASPPQTRDITTEKSKKVAQSVMPNTEPYPVDAPAVTILDSPADGVVASNVASASQRSEAATLLERQREAILATMRAAVIDARLEEEQHKTIAAAGISSQSYQGRAPASGLTGVKAPVTKHTSTKTLSESRYATAPTTVEQTPVTNPTPQAGMAKAQFTTQAVMIESSEAQNPTLKASKTKQSTFPKPVTKTAENSNAPLATVDANTRIKPNALGVSKWASNPTSSPSTTLSRPRPEQPSTTFVTGHTGILPGSLLGDRTTRPARRPEPSRDYQPNSVFSANPAQVQQTAGILRREAGVGFNNLMASMTAMGMVPNENRNPGEPAWVSAPFQKVQSQSSNTSGLTFLGAHARSGSSSGSEL